MTEGRVNPAMRLEHQGISGLGRVYYNQLEPALVNAAVQRGEGKLGLGGAFLCETGRFTGRSPKDKFVVRSPSVEGTIWWENNAPMTPAAFDQLYADMLANLEDIRVLERGHLRMDPLRHAVEWKGQEVALTVTEFMLLQTLAQRPGFVKSREQLMDVAYDDQVYVDDRTIDSHIKRLRKKMRGADDSFNAIETLYGIGYRYIEE